MDVTTNNVRNEQTKLLKASKVALTGMVIAILAGVLANVVEYFLSGDASSIMDKYNSVSGVTVTKDFNIVGILTQLAILGGFVWLAFSLRKSKSRAIAVNLIVFSVIFIVFDILTIVLAFVGIGPEVLGIIYKGITSQEIQVLQQAMYYSAATMALATVAWIIVLVGGIKGVRAPESELEENRLT